MLCCICCQFLSLNVIDFCRRRYLLPIDWKEYFTLHLRLDEALNCSKNLMWVFADETAFLPYIRFVIHLKILHFDSWNFGKQSFGLTRTLIARQMIWVKKACLCIRCIALLALSQLEEMALNMRPLCENQIQQNCHLLSTKESKK